MRRNKWLLLPLVVLAVVGVVGAVVLGSGGTTDPEGSPSLDAAAGPDSSLEKREQSAAAAQPVPVRQVDDDTVVEPDPDYERELRAASLSTRGWETDFSRHTVPFGEINSGGPPRDGIPPIDNPKFISIENASAWLNDQEPVLAFEVNEDARAYPLQILTWHEIVNDVVGGVPVAATFCPLCNSAIVFDRRLNGVTHDFGTSGKLRNSDLIMWDRQTETWWQQFTGEAIVGELAGKTLTFLPATIVSYEDFKAANPDGKVLSRDTGFSRSYGTNPYVGYDRADQPPFLYDGDLDGRLLPKERVVSVSIGDTDAAFPYSILRDERVVPYTVNGQDLVVFFKSGTTSALDRGSIKDSRDIGATGVFEPRVEGQKLTFRIDGDAIVDNETGSMWSVLGRAVEGPLSGEQLPPIVHGDHFWFSWAAFKPLSLIYQEAG